MKRNLLLTAALTICILGTNAQQQRRRVCATMEHMADLERANPALIQQRIDDEAKLQQEIARLASMRTSNTNTIYTIPVVVHVVYKTNAQNISDAQVLSQIESLNEDFGRYNADTVNTPVGFRSVASATQFQFCLAQRDPNGNSTTGIERRQTTYTSFSTNNNVKAYATGGLDAWNVNKYLNIWVCNMSGGILGYGEFPATVHTNTFGVVIQYDSFGRVGNVSYPYDQGRTCTHEFSHCFRLYHIWGDDGGACTGTDYVADTPNQADATYGCLNYPYNDACSGASANGIQFMNYMDYSDDACLNMFTANQASRMYASINSYYNTLFTSDGCQLVDGVDAINDFSFSVYPNPNDGQLSIDMYNSRNIGTEATITVTDVVGKVVSTQTVESPNGRVHQVDLTNAENGIYFVTVANNNFKRTVQFVLSR
jgi:hypothetical protein